MGHGVGSGLLVNAHSGGPTGLDGFLVVRVDIDLVGEWVVLGRGDRWDVVLVSAGEGDGRHDGLVQSRFCCSADFNALCPTALGFVVLNREGNPNPPLSVLGSATVTLTVQLSQQTSSSPRMLYQFFLRFRSKNWTVIWPRPLPLVDVGPGWACGWLRSVSSWRRRAATR